jgi:galactose-1-phosphate uridylyltransferase
MEIRFKFHVVIIHKEKMKINTLQNIRKTDALRQALQKIGCNLVACNAGKFTSVKR